MTGESNYERMARIIMNDGKPKEALTSKDVTIWAGLHVVLYDEFSSAPAYVSLQAYRECEKENERLRAAMERIKIPDGRELATLSDAHTIGYWMGIAKGFANLAAQTLSDDSSAPETKSSPPWFFEYQALVSACMAAGFRPDKEDDPNYGGRRTVLVPLDRPSAVETIPDDFCKRCNGAGEIEVYDQAGPDAHLIGVDCPVCKGTGAQNGKGDGT